MPGRRYVIDSGFSPERDSRTSWYTIGRYFRQACRPIARTLEPKRVYVVVRSRRERQSHDRHSRGPSHSESRASPDTASNSDNAQPNDPQPHGEDEVPYLRFTHDNRTISSDSTVVDSPRSSHRSFHRDSPPSQLSHDDISHWTQVSSSTDYTPSASPWDYDGELLDSRCERHRHRDLSPSATRAFDTYRRENEASRRNETTFLEAYNRARRDYSPSHDAQYRERHGDDADASVPDGYYYASRDPSPYDEGQYREHCVSDAYAPEPEGYYSGRRDSSLDYEGHYRGYHDGGADISEPEYSYYGRRYSSPGNEPQYRQRCRHRPREGPSTRHSRRGHQDRSGVRYTTDEPFASSNRTERARERERSRPRIQREDQERIRYDIDLRHRGEGEARPYERRSRYRREEETRMGNHERSRYHRRFDY